MEKVSENSQLYKIRHSLAHILAQAVLEIRPGSKLGFGPPVDDGFYYDFLFETPLTDADFADIEKRMQRIIKEAQVFESYKLPAAEAISRLEKEGQHFKAEYCKELHAGGEKEIGFYKNGPFVDMCAGPHLKNTSEVPAGCFKISSIAGAYWRGSEKNPQLVRLYALAYESKAELDKQIELRRLAEERDHRKLGRELDLYSVNHETVGGGLILWHPKGAMVRHLVEEHCKKRHLENGYDFVYTPHIGRSTLWKTSGHLDFYKDGMFAPIEIEGQEYYLKPMNCPFHCQIYRSGLRSYKELPKRFAEWGTVYRFERSGTLHGLTRVRGFTQDDAHLFCREDQMPAEIDKVLDFCLSLLRDFGLNNFHLCLSTRPKERVGEEAKWDMAESALRSALERSQLPFSINEGDGAFYGPKIDIRLSDAFGRLWQLSTIQFDFNLPERFDLTYTGADGKRHRPFMIHRALLGSVERFMANLVEHLNGAFPTWLAPVQALVLPVNPELHEYAQSIAAELTKNGFRVEIDESTQTFGKKIREAAVTKIPNVLIAGAKERDAKSVTLKQYGKEEQRTMTVEAAVTELLRLVQTKE